MRGTHPPCGLAPNREKTQRKGKVAKKDLVVGRGEVCGGEGDGGDGRRREEREGVWKEKKLRRSRFLSSPSLFLSSPPTSRVIDVPEDIKVNK